MILSSVQTTPLNRSPEETDLLVHFCFTVADLNPFALYASQRRLHVAHFCGVHVDITLCSTP